MQTSSSGRGPGMATPPQFDQIETLLTCAFGGPDEARLVRRLRAAGDMAAEYVSLQGGVVVSYAALAKFGAPHGWLALAPVATLPEFQGRGFGLSLVRAVCARHAKAQTIVVLGRPEFYQRAGFSLKRAARLTSPYPIANTLLSGPGADQPDKTLVYPAAFGAV